MDKDSEEKWKQVGSYIFDEAHALGKGVTGKVFKAFDQNKDYKEVALKVIPIELLEHYEVLFSREIALLSSIKGRHVVEFIQTLRTEQHLYIVMEYCDGGNLEENMAQEFTEEEALLIIKQIAIAFMELGNMRSSEGGHVAVMHRDIKPANILFHQKIVKVADFGFAKAVQDAEKDTKQEHTLAGTPLYMAPQVINKEKYSSKCDVWSSGMVLYELLFKELPWTGLKQQVVKQIKEKPIKFPKQISEETEDLIRKMLSYEESDRPSWEEILNHPAIKYLEVPEDGEPIEDNEN